MKTKFIFHFLALASISMYAAKPAWSSSCDTENVWTSSVVNVVGGSNLLSSPVNSVECAGSFTGNDIPYPGTNGGLNLGFYGDGLVNGAEQPSSKQVLFPDGMFSDQYGYQDLNGDGIADPGWIYLGKWENGAFTGASIGKTVTFSSTTFSVDTKNLTWLLSPSISDAQALAALLNNSVLDQFAIVFKIKNSFEAYDFTADSLGLPLGTENLYNFSGGFKKQLTKGLSHVDLYVRDPLPQTTTNVPEPGLVSLMLIGFAGMFYSARKPS